MKRQPSLGRIFLSALMLFLVLPLLLIMVFFLISSYTAAQKNITDKINIITHSIASQVNATIDSPYKYLISIADMVEISGKDDNHIKAMMTSGIKSHRAFEAIYILNNNKAITYTVLGRSSTYSGQDFIGITLSDITNTPGVRTSWSSPITSLISNTDIVRVAVKFKGGYAVGDISLKYIEDLIKDYIPDNKSSAYVVNTFGDIIASRHHEYISTNMEKHPLMDIRKTGYHALFAYKENGEYKVGAIHRIQVCDWYVIYEEPLYSAFLYYKEIVIITLISLALLGIFSAAVLYFIRIKMILPLQLLTKRSEMISEGNFLTVDRTAGNSFRELSALYDSFGRMAVTIDRREKELKDKEEYLRSVFDSTTSTGLLIISMEKEPVITDANTGAQTIFGYKLTELMGLPVSALLKGLSDNLTLMCAQSRKTGHMVTDSLTMIKKDGTEFPVLTSISPQFNFRGSIQGFIGVFIDITEITRVKRELEDEKERLDVTLKSIGEGVMAADSRDRITLVNSTAEHILGQKSRFLMGHNINDVLQIYDYDTGRLMTDRVTDFSLTDTKTYRANIPTTDSGVISVYITSSAMKNTKGELLGSVYVFRDITDRMKMEQELINRKKLLEEVNKNLEMRISEETEKRRKNEQVLFEQAKFAAMGQMISAIAHQWRQPLNALGLYVQDIEEAHENGETDNEYFENFITNAMKLIDHMSSTIDDFRNFFHSANVKEEADVTAVMLDSVSLVTPQLKNYNVSFRIKIISDGKETIYDNTVPDDYTPLNDIRLMIFPSELKQVILNIIQNARYAITEKKKNEPDLAGRIDITMTYGKDRLRIDIDDNGGNIPQNIIGRIFDPYFTTKPEGEGTGIGLYMSKIMIEDHMNGLLMSENMDDSVRFSITLGYKTK